MPKTPIEEAPLSQTKIKGRRGSRTSLTNEISNSQKRTRKNSTTKKTNLDESKIVEDSQITTRSQSNNNNSRRIKKNDKGETPLHIAVMNVK